MLRFLGVVIFLQTIIAGLPERVTPQVPTPSAWDCRRETNACLNGGACVVNNPNAAGTCVCQKPFKNYNCSDDSDSDAPTNTCGCENGGTCKTSGVCVCPSTHYGPLCKQETIQASCAVDGKILVNVNVPNITNTQVFSPGKADTCSLAVTTGGNIPPEWEGKSREITVPTDTNCGPAVPQFDGSGNLKGYCLSLIIRDNPNLLSTLDTNATFCCVDDSVTTSIGYISASLRTLRPVFSNQPAAGDSQITAQLTEPDGTTLIPDNTVKDIGDPVFLKFFLSLDADYVAFEVLECRATNFDPDAPSGVSISAQRTATFYADSCPIYGAICRGFRWGNSSEFLVHTEAVKFDESNLLYLTCDIKLCTLSSRCKNPSSYCTAPNLQARRKKRQTFSPSNTTTQISQTKVVQIRDPFFDSTVKEAVTGCIAETGRMNMTVTVIGLAVVVFFLLAMCLILGLCLIIKRAPRSDKKYHD